MAGASDGRAAPNCCRPPAEHLVVGRLPSSRRRSWSSSRARAGCDRHGSCQGHWPRLHPGTREGGQRACRCGHPAPDVEAAGARRSGSPSTSPADAMAEAALDAFGRIDALVNNAVIFSRSGGKPSTSCARRRWTRSSRSTSAPGSAPAPSSPRWSAAIVGVPARSRGSSGMGHSGQRDQPGIHPARSRPCGPAARNGRPGRRAARQTRPAPRGPGREPSST